MATRRRPQLAGARGYPGIGIDLVDLGEFSEIMARYPRWLSRVFTRRELAYCRARPRPMQHFAARFAAKEAAFKAIGTGWSSGVGWRDAEIVSTPGKPPSLIARGELARRTRALGATGFHVSLTHSGGYAAAVVMLVCRA
jgi:holo-[acyl-carrier protein] synthase